MEYKDFSKCVVCRSGQNLKDYRGEYEVTMLLNTLYLVVMYPIEKRNTLGIAAKTVVPNLEDYAQIDRCGNVFNKDDILRYLRNALAHFNIKVSPDPHHKRIECVQLWAINSDDVTKPQYKAKSNGAICEFTFSIKGLKDFTEYMIETVLKTFEDKPSTNICENCLYRD